MGGGWRPVQYLWFFLAGYLILSHEGLQRRIMQARWVCAGLTVGLSVLITAMGASPTDHADVTAWPGLLAVLGFSMKHLRFGNAFLAYAGEATLPFYILHQNVLLWIGFFVTSWQIPDIAKYLITTLSSLVVILILYEFLVRRINLLRFLFGIKPRPRRMPADARMPAPVGRTWR